MNIEIWSILLSERGVRTILLTTHFLDEAEYLADDMIVMHQGRLRAQGSTSELKAKLGGGYRLHRLPTVSDKVEEEDKLEELKIFTDVASATAELHSLENMGNRQYQITGPTIEEVFMRVAADESPKVQQSEFPGLEKGSETDGNHAVGHGKDKALVTVDSATTELRPPQRRTIRSLRQASMLFVKRWQVFRRNPLPIFFALIIPIVAAGFLTLLLKDVQNPGCALIDQVKVSNDRNLSQTLNPLMVIGPSSALGATSLELVENSLPSTALDLGSNNISILQAIHVVDNYSAFINFTQQNFANVTPGGIWLGDSSSDPTLDYLADIAISGATGITGVYNSIFMQNILDILLMNTSIAVDYAVFDFPWPPNTSNTIQFVFYIGLVMAAYPAFFSK